MKKNILTIRGLDNATIDRLKERARARGRALEADIRDILIQAARQPLILDALAEADRIAALTPRSTPQLPLEQSLTEKLLLLQPMGSEP